MRTQLENICRRYQIDALYVFGSRTEQAARSVRTGAPFDGGGPSDLDVGVLPREGHRLDVEQRVTLAGELEEVFGGGTQVDLVVLPEASPYLALDIVKGELLCVLDTDQEAEYELFVLRRAGDLAPLERERRRLVLEPPRA